MSRTFNIPSLDEIEAIVRDERRTGIVSKPFVSRASSNGPTGITRAQYRFAINKSTKDLVDGKRDQITLLSGGDKSLTEKQADDVLDMLLGNDEYVLTFTMSNGEAILYTISNNSQDFVKDYLMTGGLVEDLDSYGSDGISQLNIEDISNVKIRKISKNDGFRKKNAGFFSWINTSNIDLSEFQIYNQQQAYLKENTVKYEHCIVHSLKQCGVEDHYLQAIKLSYRCGQNLKITELKTIAKIIKRNIILKKLRPNGDIYKSKYLTNDEQHDEVTIALYKGHFMVFKNLNYTKCSIENYSSLKNVEDFHLITITRETVKANGEIAKHYERDYRAKNERNILTILRSLDEQGFFQVLDLSKFDEFRTPNNLNNGDICLDNICEEQRECANSKSLMKPCDKCATGVCNKTKCRAKDNIWFADTETFVNGKTHDLFLIGAITKNGDTKSEKYFEWNVQNEKYKNNEKKMVYDFLDRISKKGHAIVYFHNAKYDYFILKKYLPIISKCEKNGSLYSVKCQYKGKFIEIKDSYKIISHGLSKFGEIFSLDAKIRKKEAIAYEYYKRDVNCELVDPEPYRKMLSEKQKIIFDEVSKPYIRNGKFRALFYYQRYLHMDCKVLKYGMLKFQEMINTITDNKVDIFQFLTISSLTDKFFRLEGAYDGVFENCGNLREYISRAIIGGRCVINDEYLKTNVDQMLADYDACSLYPSAIKRMCDELGLPVGECRRFFKGTTPEGDGFDNWRRKNYCILSIKVKKVNKKQKIPFLIYKSKDGAVNTNIPRPDEIMIIDKITLEDYIKFHEIEYEILDGVYWNYGTNKKLGNLVYNLYQVRLQNKKTNKPLAETLKLMLNSSYGKTLPKITTTYTHILQIYKNSFVKGKWVRKEVCNYDRYLYENFNTIKKIVPLGDSLKEVESYSLDTSYSRNHIGALVLSYSKRIMNEVFDLANDNDIPIMYTDTDSMHLPYGDVTKLEQLYLGNYGKVLNGNQMGQFHIDFNLEGADSDIYSTGAIFLGKKCYIDKLECVNKDGTKVNGHHFRMKGITTEGIIHEAKKYDGGIWEMYESLTKPDSSIDFTLNPYNRETGEKKVMFEYTQNDVMTRKEYKRNVGFGENRKTRKPKKIEMRS